MDEMNSNVETARWLISDAENVIILAGAGMSVEIGNSPYWVGDNSKYGSAVSRFGHTALEHATASLWETEPENQALFFREAYQTMLEKDPNASSSPYALLQEYLASEGKNSFALTTNVDSAFLRAGWAENEIHEVHGSYRKSQCLINPSTHGVFDTADPRVDFPVCPTCGGLARPNVLFFDDYNYNRSGYEESQASNYLSFKSKVNRLNVVVLELGAGATIPTLRNHSVMLNGRSNFPVIRINPNPVIGVDGISKIVPRSKKAPFMEFRETAGEALKLLLS